MFKDKKPGKCLKSFKGKFVPNKQGLVTSHIPWNDPSKEARPHSPKFTRMLSLIAFDTLNWVSITGSSTGSSLFGSKNTSTTIYLFLNPTMILYLYRNPMLSVKAIPH